MFKKLSLLLLFIAPLVMNAQYGSFSKEVISTFKGNNLSVVLDNGKTEYNDYIKQVMESSWQINKVDFISMEDFKLAQFETERSFLVKITKSDAKKYDATFLTLVNGWKKKKGNEASLYGTTVKNIPVDHEVAYIMINADKMEQDQEGSKLWLYMKCLSSFIESVSQGKITDKATADRLYASRTRQLHEMELVMTENDLDANVRAKEKTEEFYTKPYQLVDQDKIWSVIESEERNLAVVDIIFTGEHKNRHCFKTIYNVRTGEILYLNDDASLYGKKQGLIEDDLKALERAR